MVDKHYHNNINDDNFNFDDIFENKDLDDSDSEENVVQSINICFSLRQIDSFEMTR
jgi:hypothetical protein